MSDDDGTISDISDDDIELSEEDMKALGFADEDPEAAPPAAEPEPEEPAPTPKKPKKVSKAAPEPEPEPEPAQEPKPAAKKDRAKGRAPAPKEAATPEPKPTPVKRKPKTLPCTPPYLTVSFFLFSLLCGAELLHLALVSANFLKHIWYSWGACYYVGRGRGGRGRFSQRGV